MTGVNAVEAMRLDAPTQPVPLGDAAEFSERLRTAQLTAPTSTFQPAPTTPPQADRPAVEGAPARATEGAVRNGNVIRPNVPHWNEPPLNDLAHQRGLVGPRGAAVGGGIAAAALALESIGFRNLMNRDVGRLARETGIVLDIENNPYHRAIAQEYTQNLGNSELGRLYRAPMTRDQALEVLQYRLAELERLQPNPDAAREPAPEGTVRLQIGAVTHTIPADRVQPDPSCHPNGFWAPDPSYPATLARLPDAARYQDQINGGHVGLNYYIPTSPTVAGTPVSGTMAVQTYDGCITPQSALAGAPVVDRPTLVEAKHGYGAFFQIADREGFLDTQLQHFTEQARRQVDNSGGAPVAWFASDPTAAPIFRRAVASEGVSVTHVPLQ